MSPGHTQSKLTYMRMFNSTFIRKLKLRNYCTPNRTAPFKTLTSPEHAKSIEQQERNSTAILNMVEQFTYKVKHTLTLRPAIMLIAHLSNELKAHDHTKPCTKMISGALFLTVQTWKHQ